MNKFDIYIHAATRENTRRSYQSAVQHFETEWGGFLPATADSVARYLVDHADMMAINTLRQRLAAIAQWHIIQGFPDPTKEPIVRKVFRGIRALHPAQEKRARPLQLEQLEQTVQWLNKAITFASATDNRPALLRHTRDLAILLLGFWRGFRGDELTRLQIQYIDVKPGEGMTCFLPQTKGDRHNIGTTFKAPALARLCPVTAYSAWIKLAAKDQFFAALIAGVMSVSMACTSIAWCRYCVRYLIMPVLPTQSGTAAIRCGAGSRIGQTQTAGTSRH